MDKLLNPLRALNNALCQKPTRVPGRVSARALDAYPRTVQVGAQRAARHGEYFVDFDRISEILLTRKNKCLANSCCSLALASEVVVTRSIYIADEGGQVQERKSGRRTLIDLL